MLHNLSILVTRPIESSEILASGLRMVGALPLVTPMIEIIGIEAGAIGLIKKDFDCAVFVSKNAVQFGLPVLAERGVSLKNKTIFAIGPKTALALADFGINKVISPNEVFNTEGLLDSSSFKLAIANKKGVLVFRATDGRELLANTLRESGCNVEYFECYVRKISQNKIRAELKRAGIEAPDVILVTSSGILSALVTKIKQERLLGLLGVQTIVLGERLVTKVLAEGFVEPPLVVNQLTNDSIISCLVDWVKRRN